MTPRPQSAAGPRRTRQRTAIETLLAQRGDFVSAQRIRTLLAEAGIDIGLATVYRTLAAMVQSASVDTIVSDSGELLYRKCSDGHHHHLVCRRCGTTVEVHDPQVERWADDVATLHGFREVQHNVEIVGLCQACAQDGPAA